MKSNKLIIKDVAERINKSVSKGIDKSLDSLEKSLPRQIKKRAQLGQGGNFNKDRLGGSGKKFKELKESTIKQRNIYKKKLSSNTTPGRSNQTATGKMLNSLKARKRPGQKIEIDTSDKKRAGLTGKGKKISNIEVRELNEKKGRTFLGLLDFEVIKAQRTVRKEVLKEVRKANK